MNDALKKRAKAAKLDHDLHVALLMKREGLSKSDAIVMAYLDGYAGLDARMTPPERLPNGETVVATIPLTRVPPKA